ncbi:hypothetical protein CHUAL_002957 [Chamberlinius hualienensis]
MDTTATAETRDDFTVRGGGNAASRGSLTTATTSRYVSSHAHPPPPPPSLPPHPHHDHLPPLHSHHVHHHHLHHSGSSATTGLLMTGPTGMLDSTTAASDAATAAHYAQSPGSNSASIRTGVPHEIGRPGPQHATPAASVSAPSPLPSLQCQDRFFSSLTINTGTNYAFLNGCPAPTLSASSMPAPMSASSPFRTPPGMANVHSHWSQTPPPSPLLDSYGRYGLGPNFYSIYPMLTGNDANALCLQASAAKLLQRNSTYYSMLDRSRDFGLYHPASFPIGSPFSPSLSSLESAELSSSGSASAIGSLPDFIQQRIVATAPYDFINKSANVNSGTSKTSVGNKSGVISTYGNSYGSVMDEEKNKKSCPSSTVKDIRAKSNVNGKSINGNSKVDGRSISAPKDQKCNDGDSKCGVAESSLTSSSSLTTSATIKREITKNESCRKRQKLNVSAESDSVTIVGASGNRQDRSPVSNDSTQVQALNLSCQDVKKSSISSAITTTTTTAPTFSTCNNNKILMKDYNRLYGTTFLPYDPSQVTLALKMSPSTSNSSANTYVTQSPLSPPYSSIASATNVCDNTNKSVRVKVEPQRPQCSYQTESSTTIRPNSNNSCNRQGRNNSRAQHPVNGVNGIDAKSGDYDVLNLITHSQSHDNQRDEGQPCCLRSNGHPNVHLDGLNQKTKISDDIKQKQYSEELNNQSFSEKKLSRVSTITPPVLQCGKGPPSVAGNVNSTEECSSVKINAEVKSSVASTSVKDELSSKVAVKGSHIESITNKLLATKSQLGVCAETATSSAVAASAVSKPVIAQPRVQQHTKCRRKSVVVDKIVTQNENTIVETKHSTQLLVTPVAEVNRDSPVQSAPYDYTLKQASGNSTFTVTTTTPVTPTTTTMTLQHINSGTSFQRCFTEHVHKSMATAAPISSELNFSDRSSSSSSLTSSSPSSPINVTDIDSSPSTAKWPSNAQSEEKVTKFSSKGNGIDVQVFDRKLRSKLTASNDTNSNSSVEGSSSSIFSHSLNTGTSSIPVGIAVAQQRQEVQLQCKQRSDTLNCKQGMLKCGTQSGLSKSGDVSSSTKSPHLTGDILMEKSKMVCCDKSSTNDAPALVTSSAEFPPGLVIAGGTPMTTSCWTNDDKSRWFPGTHPALWLGQSSFTGSPTSLSMQLGSADHLTASLPPHPPPSHPLPPIGYQLARDPITNHLYLIPTTNINLMERPPTIWPTAPTVSQLPAIHKPFQSCIFSSALSATANTSATAAISQQISSPVLTNNRIAQDRVNFDCNFNSDCDKALNMSSIAVSSSQKGSEVSKDILNKSSVIKEEEDKVVVDSTTSSSVAISNSQSCCFDLQPSTTVPIISEALSGNSSPSLVSSCSCLHVSPKVHVESSSSENQQPNVEIPVMKVEVAKMADACNQTETPPLTDEDENEVEEPKDVAVINQPPSSASSTVLRQTMAPNIALTVKVEEVSVQCELSDEIGVNIDEKRESLNVQGLDLLSKTIAEHNLGATNVKIKVDTPKVEAEECEKDFKGESCQQSHEDFGGLGLLCALAEQRILQETNAIFLLLRELPKTNKDYGHFLAHKQSQYSSSSPSLSSLSIGVNTSSKDNVSSAFKSVEKEPSDNMQTKLKLVDLRKKYKEKEKELAKLTKKESESHSSSRKKPGRPKKSKKSSKESFKFGQLKQAKLSLLSCHKKITSFTTNDLSSSSLSSSTSSTSSSNKSNGQSNDNNSNFSISRSILNPPTLVTSTPKTMSTLDKWTSSLAACPPSLFQLVPNLKKSSATKSSVIFTNLKPQLPPPPLSSAKLSLSTTGKSTVAEVGCSSKGQTSTPDETTTETSDSDDSSLCQSNKVKAKPLTSKSRTKDQQRVKRKDGLSKGGNGGGTRSRNEDQKDDSRSVVEVEHLSLSFSSLSVSCTMPPFKGHVDDDGDKVKEEPAVSSVPLVSNNIVEDDDSSGLGLLATCAATQATTFDQIVSTAYHSADEGNGITEEKDVCEESNNVRNIIEAKSDTSPNSDFSPTVDSVKSHEKMQAEDQPTSTTTPTKCKYSYLEDEAWQRRRSERIFLNEPSCKVQTNVKNSFQSHNEQIRHRNTSASGSTGHSNSTNSFSGSSSSGVSREITVSAAMNAVSAVTGLTSWKARTEETTKMSKKRGSSKTKTETEPCTKKIKLSAINFSANDGQPIKSSLLSRPISQSENSDKIVNLSPSSSESDSDSPAETSSYSEGDNLPLSHLVERPITPEPRSCVINAEELKDSLRVLTMIDRLFYSGRVVGIRPPDVYGITVDGERGNRPHIYSREEIFQEAVVDVKPGSIRYLPEGTRVCAYWSQQYRCLYPGKVAKSTSPSSSPESEGSVLVEFDDGDSGRISVDNIRLLPPDLPLISYDRDPLNITKRRTKSTGDISQEKRTPIVALVDNQKEKTSKSADRVSSTSTDVSNRDTANKQLSNNSRDNFVGNSNPRKLFENDKKLIGNGKRMNDEVNNNSSGCSSPSKLNDISRIPSVKALYGSQILSATVSVVPLSRSTTPTSTAGSTVSSSGCKPIRSVSAGFSSSSSSPSSSVVKSRKHKKHKNNKNDSRKKHHHHHRRHRHKHKHEKKSDSASRDQNSGIKLVKIESAKEDASVEGKKQELTLKIRTNIEANRAEIETKRENGGDGCRWNVEKSAKASNSAQITPVNESTESKLLYLNEPLPPRKARIAKKEDLSVVSSTRPKAKRKERSNSVETKSKIAAFLPARQLWRWSGKSYRRPGAKGKAKKDFYKAITRGKETIRVGDSAVFLSTGRPHLPFIGRIITMWESWGGNMIVKVRWFYHPEETKGGKKLVFNKGALYQSYHIDENDVQTISHKCEVLSWAEYRKYKDQEANQSSGSSIYDNCDVYYLAGSYDPTAGVVTLEEGVS